MNNNNNNYNYNTVIIIFLYYYMLCFAYAGSMPARPVVCLLFFVLFIITKYTYSRTVVCISIW